MIITNTETACGSAAAAVHQLETLAKCNRRLRVRRLHNANRQWHHFLERATLEIETFDFSLQLSQVFWEFEIVPARVDEGLCWTTMHCNHKIDRKYSHQVHVMKTQDAQVLECPKDLSRDRATWKQVGDNETAEMLGL